MLIYEVRPFTGFLTWQKFSIFWQFLIKLETISRAGIHIGENELVARLKSRDRVALEYLYDHYSAALFGAISRVVRMESAAEEVLQDVFLRIWDRIDDYDAAKGRLFTWMLRIARNQAIDKTRSRGLMNERKTDDIDNFVHGIDAKAFSEQKVDFIGVDEILKDLPEDQKFVVEYLYFKGYSQSELAKEYNIPLGTVKTRLRIAMKQLRSLIKVD
jgi:RNA polymerase sigma-70 factor (ECF subfamily)